MEAVLGTSPLEASPSLTHEESVEEESAIADVGLGVYLTMTGSTARDYGLELGEQLFPSETVLLENAHERTETTVRVAVCTRNLKNQRCSRCRFRDAAAE